MNNRNSNNNNNLSFNVALGGVCAALALVLMLATSVFPVLDFAIPAAAGALMAVIVIEINKKWAFMTYAAISAVSLLVVPSKEAGLLFAAFLGYYPIIKSIFEKQKNKYVQLALKLGVFNAAIVVYYQLTLRLVTDAALMEEAESFGKYGLAVLWLAANVVFVIYDIALTRLISMYYNWFRKKFLRR